MMGLGTHPGKTRGPAPNLLANPDDPSQWGLTGGASFAKVPGGVLIQTVPHRLASLWQVVEGRERAGVDTLSIVLERVDGDSFKMDLGGTVASFLWTAEAKVLVGDGEAQAQHAASVGPNGGLVMRALLRAPAQANLDRQVKIVPSGSAVAAGTIWHTAMMQE